MPAELSISLITPLLVAVVFQALLSIGLYLWGRWVARRQQGGRWWRRAAWLPVLGFGLAVAGVGLSAYFLLQGFADIRQAEAADKAARLATAISNAMNSTAFFLLPSSACYLASLVTCLVGTFRRRRRQD